MAKLAAVLLSVLMAAPALAVVRDWDGLLTEAVASDYVLETPYGFYRVLAHVDPNDTTKSRRAEYFSVVGFPDGAGGFNRDHIEVVSENWHLNELGSWEIDQWAFSMTLEGELVYSMHNYMNIDADNRVHEHRAIPETPESFAARWNALKLEWLTGFVQAAPPAR